VSFFLVTHHAQCTKIPIHNSDVITLESGQLLLYYHYASLKKKMMVADYIFGYNYLTFDDGWPYVTAVQEEGKVPTVKEQRP
jgi:hypothetical protein